MSSNATQGFAGSVTALSVVDVLQLQCGNRFSGSIVFSHQGLEAAVYFQHGEVVHAECGEARAATQDRSPPPGSPWDRR